MGMMGTMREDRILVVDDDPSWQELLAETIGGLGTFDLRIAGSFAQADALLDRQHFHLAFVDLRLRENTRDLEGKQIARKIVDLGEGTSIVMATGHADVSTAIVALKEWKVLDFVLKDAWDPDKVAGLVRDGLAAGRAAYRARYESAIDWLRDGQPVLPWVAEVLRTVAPDTQAPWPDRRLGDFLNRLVDGLYPLLPRRDGARLVLDAAAGSAQASCWSKARGCPMALRFGRQETLEPEMAALAAGPGFARCERSLRDDGLGIGGALYVPAVPAFDAFARA
jgi:ActR/RegA family two-component response regulator